MSFGYYMLERLLDSRHNPFAFRDDQKITPASLFRAVMREHLFQQTCYYLRKDDDPIV
jgi:hypothetical protein